MNQTHIPIGGDFSQIFDHKDYLAMISIPDEATCVLRGHLILEELLNLWSSKITQTEDLYAGAFVAFKTKLIVSKNLGLSEELYKILDNINKVRNRFSHRKNHELEDSVIESLKSRVNGVVPSAGIHKCENFQVFVGGKSQDGDPKEISYTWDSSDNRVRFVIIFVVLMLKLTQWIQEEFSKRRINYTIISAVTS